METLAVAILGINGTLVGCLIWLLKATFTKLFGSDTDPGLVIKLNTTMQSMNTDIKANTVAILELQRVFRESSIGKARRTASDPHQADA